jgi:hypothetical protein
LSLDSSLNVLFNQRLQAPKIWIQVNDLETGASEYRLFAMPGGR